MSDHLLVAVIGMISGGIAIPASFNRPLIGRVGLWPLNREQSRRPL